MARSSSRALWTAKLTGQPVRRVVSAEIRRAPSFSGTVLGIDPSLRGTGLAVVTFTAGNPAFGEARTVRLSPRLSMVECLGEIGRAVTAALDARPIDALAIEETIYVQNFQTAQILGAARGAALTPAAMREVPCYSYAPLRIKQAVVGYGRASKEQVAAMIRQVLGLPETLASDEADAAAVAICHGWTVRSEQE